jgi:hypothetical protein
MQLLLKKILPAIDILVTVVFTSVNCFAQAHFKASISPSVIGKDETAQLTLMVENAQQVQLVSIPSLQNFSIVNGPSQENGMESINGNVRRYIAYTYTIQPKRSGDFTIGVATARADGKLLQTNPIHLKVSNIATGNTPSSNDPFAGLSPFEEPAPINTYNDFVIKKGENVQDKINRNIFIKVQPDKTTCFIGEPIVVTYKLYTRLKSESNIIKSPSFSGFSVIDLTSASYENYSIEKMDGRMYNVYILRKAQLYPLQAGQATLEMIQVENKLNFIKADFLKNNNLDDYIGGVFQPALPPEAVQLEKITLESKPVTIAVKALPKPDTAVLYNGAVGDFSIQSWVDKANFTTDETGNLHITLSGTGNLTLVNAPDIKWPNGIEFFDAVVKDTLNRLSIPVSGSISYHIPFTVGNAGVYILPSIVFTFFNAGSGTYKTIKTQPIALTIAKGSGKKRMTNEPGNNSQENFFEIIFTNRWMIIIPIALLIITGLLIWLKIDNKKSAKSNATKNPLTNENLIIANQQLPIGQIVTNPFEQSEKQLLHHDSRQFYKTLLQELMQLLAFKLQLGIDAFNKTHIEGALNKADISLTTTLTIKQLLNDIELQLYTPFADESLQEEMYERALQIAATLNQVQN